MIQKRSENESDFFSVIFFMRAVKIVFVFIQKGVTKNIIK